MKIPKDRKKLVRLFTRLGEKHPEEWADAQIRDPKQIYRYLFLRQAWTKVGADGDESWIDEQIEYSRKHPDRPFAGLGKALENCLAAGARRVDLVEIVRCKEVMLLHAICYLLEDPSFGDVPAAIEEIGWGLFPAVDEEPCGQRIGGLQESLLALDPTDREMRPKAV